MSKRLTLPKFLQGLVKVGRKNVSDPIQMGEEMAKCSEIGWGACPAPFLKIKEGSGNGKDYFWNDNGTLTNGTKAEFEAYAAAL
jgi:hypothetical protein